MNLEKILILLILAEKRARQDYDNAHAPNQVHFYRGRMEAYQMAIEIINENIYHPSKHLKGKDALGKAIEDFNRTTGEVAE